MKKSRLVLDFFILRQLVEFIIKLSPDLHRSEKKSGRNPAVLLRDPPLATIKSQSLSLTFLLYVTEELNFKCHPDDFYQDDIPPDDPFHTSGAERCLLGPNGIHRDLCINRNSRTSNRQCFIRHNIVLCDSFDYLSSTFRKMDHRGFPHFILTVLRKPSQ
jgi:hypothetical protein